MESIRGLEDALDSLRLQLVIWTFLVALGLVLEYRAEIIKLLRIGLKIVLFKSAWFERRAFRRTLMHSIGGVLVTIGVAGELWIEFVASSVETNLRIESDKVFSESSERTAKLEALARSAESEIATSRRLQREAEARIASAQEQAAKAMESAAKSDAERAKLEAQVAPRRLTPEQRRSIAFLCSSFRGKRVSVTTYTLDTESAVLARQIMEALHGAGIFVDDRTATEMPMGSFAVGVHINGTRKELDSMKMAVGILRAFKASGAKIAVVANAPEVGGTMMATGGTSTASVHILVGVKPPQD